MQSASLSPVHGSPRDEEVKKEYVTAQIQNANDKISRATTTAEFQEAADILKKVIKVNRNDYVAQRTLGWIYLDKLHDPHAAYPHLVIAARGQPDDLDSRRLLGLACSQTGRTRQAAEEFARALKLKPDDVWVRANLGRSLAKLGRYEEANTHFTQALLADPTSVDAQLGRAEVEAWQGNLSNAMAILDPLLQANPRNAEALALRGDINRWNWRLTAAQDDYRQALSIAENDYNATVGLAEVEKLRKSYLHGGGYYFKDTSDFERASVNGGLRLRMADKVYLLGDAAGWRFKNPGIDEVERVDGFAGLEIDWARWLQTSAQFGAFEYRDGESETGGRGRLKLSPGRNADLYAAAAYRQPFVSSIATVLQGLTEDTVGGGLDLRLSSRVSVQGEVQLGRISDDNEWWQAKPQLSFRLWGSPNERATFLRVEYDYLTFSEVRTNYWTPDSRHVVSPVLDVCLPLGRHFQINVVAKAPYVFDASEFGWQMEGGPVFDINNRVQVKASYIYSSIPADRDVATATIPRPPWSGQGGQVSLLIRF
jgi:Flp pilus assembly protein TadD